VDGTTKGMDLLPKMLLLPLVRQHPVAVVPDAPLQLTDHLFL